MHKVLVVVFPLALLAASCGPGKGHDTAPGGNTASQGSEAWSHAESRPIISRESTQYVMRKLRFSPTAPRTRFALAILTVLHNPPLLGPMHRLGSRPRSHRAKSSAAPRQPQASRRDTAKPAAIARTVGGSMSTPGEKNKIGPCHQ